MTLDLASMDDGTLENLGAAVSQALRVVRLAGRASIPLVAEIYQPSDDDSVEFALRPPQGRAADLDEALPAGGVETSAPVPEETIDDSSDGPVVAPVAMVPEEVPQSSGPIIPVVVPSPLKVEELPVAAEFSADMTAAAMARWVRQIDPDGSRAYDDLSLVQALRGGFGISQAAEVIGLSREDAVARWREICPIVTLHTQQLLAKALSDRLKEAREAS